MEFRYSQQWRYAMRTNQWFCAMAIAIVFSAFVSVPVSADDASPKDGTQTAVPSAEELKAVMESLEVRYKELCKLDALNPYVDVDKNLQKMLVWSFSSENTLTDEEKILVGDLMWVKRETCKGLKSRAFALIYNSRAAEDPAKVEEAKVCVAELERRAIAYTNDYQRLLKKCFPMCDLVEPMKTEFLASCDWAHEDAWKDLKYFYILADQTTIFTDEEKKQLEDLGVRYEHGRALESELRQLLWDDVRMSDLKNHVDAYRLIAKFKCVTKSWRDDYRRLREKVFPSGMSDRERRVRDQAKRLDEKNVPASPQPK